MLTYKKKYHVLIQSFNKNSILHMRARVCVCIHTYIYINYYIYIYMYGSFGIVISEFRYINLIYKIIRKPD